jgi:hypothetical protein
MASDPMLAGSQSMGGSDDIIASIWLTGTDP